jgi:hypothetical protein
MYTTTTSSLEELLITTEPKNDRFRLLCRLSYSVSYRASVHSALEVKSIPGLYYV